MNNPPAFPHSHLGINKGQLSYEDSDYSDGMTLRDYFAAAAMQGLIASNDEGAGDRITEIPDYAYLIADAMLKAREK